MTTQAIQAGSTSIDVTLPRLDGGELNLAKTQGRRVLVFMWASW
jgi:peroxiredoxin